MNPNHRGCQRPGYGPQSRPAVPDLPVSEPSKESKEPSVRRWPHPVTVQRSSEPLAAELHELRCLLARQAQLLTEIRALLEQRTENSSPTDRTSR